MMNQPTQHLIASANTAYEAKNYAQVIELLEQVNGYSDQAAMLNKVAECHYHLNAKTLALQLLHQAAALPDADIQTFNNLAVISSELGDAVILNESALTAKSWNSIGLNYYFRGDFDQARGYLEKSIEVDPQYYAGYYNVMDLIKKNEAEQWLQRTRDITAEKAIDKASMGYFRAELYKLLGDTSNAFKHWQIAANARYDAIERPYIPKGWENLVDEIIALFDQAHLAELKLNTAASPRTIFIVGLPRSGSTLTSQMLLGDSTLVDLGENRTLATAIVAELERYGDGQQHFSAIDQTSLLRTHKSYCQELASTSCYLDKYLENFMYLGLIWAAFPNAKVIHCVRDRFDTLFSCYTKNFTLGNAWTYKPEHLAHYERMCTRLMDHWKAVLPNDFILTSQYEELTQNQGSALEKLCEHCGLDAAAAATKGHKNQGKVFTASAQQVRADIIPYTTSPYEKYKSMIEFPIS